MSGDMVLMKLDAFQGKRKVKDRWGEVEYLVVHQVADDVRAYKVRDYGGKVRSPTITGPFLSGPCKGRCHAPGRKRVRF